jgi:hypothetical protein
MVSTGSTSGGSAFDHSGDVDASQKACGDISHIAFYTCDLPGEKQVRPAAKLQGWIQQQR